MEIDNSVAQSEQKSFINDIDFDNLDNNDLKLICDEIETIFKVRALKAEYQPYLKNWIKLEKERMKRDMLKQLQKEKDKMLLEYREEIENQESDQDSDIDAIIYDKKNPKGSARKIKKVTSKK